MKIIKTTIVMLLLVLIQLPGYAQSENNMPNNTITIPLKIGKNHVTHFDSLDIKPIKRHILNG